MKMRFKQDKIQAPVSGKIILKFLLQWRLSYQQIGKETIFVI